MYGYLKNGNETLIADVDNNRIYSVYEGGVHLLKFSLIMYTKWNPYLEEFKVTETKPDIIREYEESHKEERMEREKKGKDCNFF